MRFVSTDMVAGYQAKELRGYMRELRSRCDRQNGVPTRVLGVLFHEPMEQVAAILEGEGLIERIETPERTSDEILWQTTYRGNALAIAKFIQPVSRHKAQATLDGFLERVALVNQRGSGWLSGVAKVELYGSFADPQIDPVGDVDLQVFTFRRWSGGSQRMWDHIEKFIESRGANPSSFMGRLGYPERALQSYLKGRNPLLSIAWDVDQRDQLGITPVTLYETETFEDLS